jgi:ClpX C4-type zinc finger
MLCYEVILNGTKICLAGHSSARLLIASLVAGRGADAASLQVDAQLAETPQQTDDVRWADLPVQIGDELLIRVMNATTAEIPKHRRSFGRRITSTSTGEVEDSCSFCGEKGEVRLIKGTAGNICDKCVTLCQEILEEEKASGAASSEE